MILGLYYLTIINSFPAHNEHRFYRLINAYTPVKHSLTRANRRKQTLRTRQRQKGECPWTTTASRNVLKLQNTQQGMTPEFMWRQKHHLLVESHWNIQPGTMYLPCIQNACCLDCCSAAYFRVQNGPMPYLLGLNITQLYKGNYGSDMEEKW